MGYHELFPSWVQYQAIQKSERLLEFTSIDGAEWLNEPEELDTDEPTFTQKSGEQVEEAMDDDESDSLDDEALLVDIVNQGRDQMNVWSMLQCDRQHETVDVPTATQI